MHFFTCNEVQALETSSSTHVDVSGCFRIQQPAARWTFQAPGVQTWSGVACLVLCFDKSWLFSCRCISFSYLHNSKPNMSHQHSTWRTEISLWNRHLFGHLELFYHWLCLSADNKMCAVAFLTARSRLKRQVLNCFSFLKGRQKAVAFGKTAGNI